MILKNFGIFAMFIILLSMILIPTIEAKGTNRADYYGYFDNKEDYYGSNVISSGIPANVNSADSFIGFIFNNLANGSNQDKTGANFIVSTMIGKKQGSDGLVSRNISFCPPSNPNCTDSDWYRFTTLVKGYANNGWINFNAQYAYSYNTFYQDDHNDVAGYSVPLTTDSAIVFAVPGTTIDYAIRKACANPVGDFEPLLSLATIYREASVSTPTINANDGGEATFTNNVNTKDLINVPFNDLFTFGVRTIINENGKGSDNTGATWGAGSALGPYNVRIINPTLTGAGTPAPNYSTAKLTIAKGSTNLIGKNFCRILDVSGQPRYASVDGWTKGLACVTIVGDAGNNVALIDNNNSEYEKGSLTDESNLNVNAILKTNSMFCDPSNANPQITIYVVQSIDGISGENSTAITVPNCVKITNDINLPSITLSVNDLNGKDPKSYPVNTSIYLKPGKLDKDLLANHVGSFVVYEAPFTIFGGNDVRACPADTDKSRFVFKPSAPNDGSSSRLASLWGTGTTLDSDNTNGWSKSLNTYNNFNRTKSSGIDCDDAYITTKNSDKVINSTTTPDTVVEGNVYINGSINITAPSVYQINANNVYISQDVKYLKNVIINATNVYTCTTRGGASGDTKIKKDSWHTECTNPLRIEGSVNAKNLYLMRSVGTRYKSNGLANQVEVGVTSPINYDLTDNLQNRLKQPAEVFVYPAYFYFTNVGASGSGSTKGSIDSYSQAPPRL